MSNKSFAIIQMRRGTNGEFASANTVLASGEPAYAYDLNIMKVGDGQTAWSSLLPVNVSGVVTFPTIVAGGNITATPVGDTYVIAAVGLSQIGHQHVLADITDFDANDYAPSGNYAASGHQHILADITDFDANDYSPSGHQHPSSDITDRASLYQVDVMDFGIQNSGSFTVDWGVDRQIQTMSLDGTYTEFVQGSGWPATSGKSCDVVLRLTADYPTSTAWYIPTSWINAPPPDPLPQTTHLFLFRAIGLTIDGHYLGSGIY